MYDAVKLVVTAHDVEAVVAARDGVELAYDAIELVAAHDAVELVAAVCQVLPAVYTTFPLLQ